MLTLVLALAALGALYAYCTRDWRYWARRGVKHDPPLPLLGNSAPVLLQRLSMTQMLDDLYRRYPGERVVGFYRGAYPELLIRDLDIAKRLFITDFPDFAARGHNRQNVVIEPMMRSIASSDGDLWKLLRQRLTPTFSSGKVRAMFPLIAERAERLRAHTLSAAAAGRPLDARDLMTRYTTDFIGACVLGLDAKCLQDENSAFRNLGTKIFERKVTDAIVPVLKETFPMTFRHLKFFGRCEKDIINLVKEILNQRNYEPAGKNDFIDLMLECRKQGIMTGESIERFKPDGTPETASIELDDELIAAQVFLFFAAGFDTSSTASSYTLLQLAYHLDVQKKVQEEVDRVLTKYDGKLCYDAVKEMKYLEMAFQESLRLFPSVGYLFRKCVRQYTIPELNITIDPGVVVFVSVQSLHKDPLYFDNPEEFRPERFSPDAFKDKSKQAYIPFGLGPRACLGERMGRLESLAGLAALLSRFSVSPAAGTPCRPPVDPKVYLVQGMACKLMLVFSERTATA